jgi:tetratricopeptide (TPR) repeat protein
MALATELADRMRLASDNYEQVITELLANTEQHHYADWLVLAQAYLSANNKDAAIAALQHADDLASSDRQHAHVALLLAKVYGILFRDTRHAINYLQQADTLLRDSTDMEGRQLYSEVLTNFAQAHNQLGDLTQAEHFASQSLSLALSLEDPHKELAARIMLGRIALQNNRFNQAHHQLQQALILADKLDDSDARASIHFRLGMAFRKIDEHTLALEHMQQAASLYQSLKNLSSYSYTLVYIAESYLEVAEGIPQAEQYLLEALAISEQINNVMRTAIIKKSLGRVSRLRGENLQAAEHYNAALQQFRQIGAQTYVQESALALAELALLQQQFTQTEQIIAELSPGIDSAANYLQARYYSLRAQLAEHRQDWQQAFMLNQQASKLEFSELTTSTAEKLSELKNQLSQRNTQHDNHAAQVSQQKSLSLTLRYWQLTTVVLVLLLLGGAYLYWCQRKRHNQRQSVQMPFLLSQNWHRFCQRLKHDGRSKQPIQLLAIALPGSQQLKLDQGENALQHQITTLLNNLSTTKLSGCCINSNVLWLGYRASPAETTYFARQLERDIQQALSVLTIAGPLVSLQLEVTQLLGPRWQVDELTALREALWLSWKLASITDDASPCWQLQLSALQPRPCEWQSSNIRLDMINALQLGALKLTLNNEALPANLSRALVAELGETREL